MSEEHRPSRRSGNSGGSKKKSGAKSKSSDSSAVLLWGAIGGGALLIVVLLVVAVLRPWRAVEVAGPVEQGTTKQDVPPPELPKPKAKAFSERGAAEWVVSVGGRVLVLEPGRNSSYDVYTSGALPKGDFRVESLGLDGIDAVNDQQIDQLWGLTAMSDLGLSRTKVTDNGLEVLPQLQTLSTLNLKGCLITDRGLMSLGRMPNLKFLVADGGESPLPQPFTDDGIKHLAKLAELRTLSLVSDKVSNPGLASIAQSSSKLVQLRTVGFQVNDEGVLPLTKLSDLRVLELSKSKLTDKCIDTLSQLKWLTHLIVQGTQITPDGVKRLQQQLPNCQVFGGKYDPRRNAIRDILLVGGKVTLTPDGQPQQVLARFEDLPEKFTVQSIDLTGVKSLKLEDLVLSEATDLILTEGVRRTLRVLSHGVEGGCRKSTEFDFGEG